jgi:hypothetical protein
MQESYISLNPANNAREEKAIRSRLYTQRLLESQGGKISVLMGAQWGITATLLTYSYMQSKHSFGVFPIAGSKLASYGKMGAAFLGFYVLGHSYVMGKFGDQQQFNYLFTNKQAILNGTSSWERPAESA